MFTRKLTFLAPLVLTWVAGAQTVHLPATGLCNTGLTKASPLPKGCSASSLVTPQNPDTGGTSVDGNWELATPYPSGENDESAPNPCLLEYGPAWVDQPWPGWFNPDDGISQYITPAVISPTDAVGWYIYRTAMLVPPAPAGTTHYILTVAGQVSIDNYLVAIALENPAQYLPSCRSLETLTGTGFSQWSPFTFTTVVAPNSHAYLYFVTYNYPNNPENYGNPTGMRVEFTSAYFTLEQP